MRYPLARKAVAGTIYMAGGVFSIAIGLNTDAMPPLSTLSLFVALAAIVDWRSAELAPRLRASATVMVIVAAGVAFLPYNPGLAMAIVSAIGAVGPTDIRKRRVFYPAANFGQLTMSGMVAGTLLDWLSPSGGTENLGYIVVLASVAGFTYSTLNLSQVMFILRIVHGRDERPRIRDVQAAVPAHAILGAVGGLLGATYVIVGPEVTPFIVIMVLMAHFAATSYAGVRESQNSTMRGFIKALEARDLFSRGHNERTAEFARMIGDELGLSDQRMERIRWAVLLSDVSSLAVPRDLIEHQDNLTPEEDIQIATYTGTVDDMLMQVDFLRPAMEIVRQRDFSGPPRITDDLSLDAHILGVAKRFDQLTTNRARAEALRQHEAFEELRMSRKHRFARQVVDALERAIQKTGMTYGKIDVAKVTAEDIARQRMYERR